MDQIGGVASRHAFHDKEERCALGGDSWRAEAGLTGAISGTEPIVKPVAERYSFLRVIKLFFVGDTSM